jgi:hypothetical protein
LYNRYRPLQHSPAPEAATTPRPATTALPAEPESAAVDEFQLEDFLHPDSSSIRRLIEHHVLKNPNLLTEMLSVKFSDLGSILRNSVSAKNFGIIIFWTNVHPKPTCIYSSEYYVILSIVDVYVF